ncbi:MAG: ABC transporter ATP-binding protein [Minisyncoccia bacterium]
MDQIRIVYRQYVPHLRNNKRYITLTLIGFGTATIVSAIFSPLILKSIIDTVSTGTPTPATATTLYWLFLGLIATRTITWASYRIGDYYTTYFQVNVMRDLSHAIFTRLTKHSYEFFTHQFTGSLVSHTNKLVRAFEQLADFITFNLFSEGMRLVISVAVLTYIAPILGLLFFVLVSIYFIIYAYYFKESYALKEELSTTESKTTGVLADALSNILSIKMFAQTEAEWARFKDTVSYESDRRLASWTFQAKQGTIQRASMLLFELLAMGTALYLWAHAQITAGTIVLLQIYIFAALDIVYNVTRNLSRALGSLADATLMATVLETPESVQDPKIPEVLKIKDGEIRINNIHFKYEKSSEVFTDFSLAIGVKEKVGLVGHSGSGKTTITKLLLRFADVQSGSITIDGQDIRNITQEDLRSQIAYVPQDPLLFHRSIKENIRYGRPTATDEEVIAVAKRAHAHDFISSLPHGYDTLVGERGIRLSGGERQRVAIARAMIKNAPILILDEATSALDSMSERNIQHAFKELMYGKTVIVIAHRLSTIQEMDRIVVFDSGAIIEEGTHSKLVEKNGVYAEFWKEQTSAYID